MKKSILVAFMLMAGLAFAQQPSPSSVVWGSRIKIQPIPASVVWGSVARPASVVWGSRVPPASVVWGSRIKIRPTPASVCWGSAVHIKFVRIDFQRHGTGAVNSSRKR